MVKKDSRHDRQALQVLLRQLRVDSGMRQIDLAIKLRQPQSYVSKYESGERRLDLLELREICAALEISLTEFVLMFEENVH